MAYIGNGPGVSSQRIVSEFEPTTDTTSFTPSSGYTVGYVDVYLNGIKLQNGTDFTASNGTSVVLTDAAVSGDLVEIVAYIPRGLSDGYTKSESDARYEPIDTAYTKAEADARYMDINAVTLPDQTGHNGQFLQSDGTNADWATVDLGSRVAKTGDSMTGNLTFGDNDKAIFGAGSDLQIFHSGIDSRIKDVGTGNLVINAGSFVLNNASDTQNMIIAYEGGAVTSYYGGSARLATTSTGIDVTGSITASSSVTGTLKQIVVIANSGTYTVPSDVGNVKVYVTGGGGGGGSHNTDDAQGGGGAGGTAIKVIDLSSVSSVYCTVGGGGSGGVGNTAGSTSGNASSFGSYCSASGGGGTPNWGAGGRGGVGSGGDLNLYGSDGQTGNIDGYGNSEAAGNGGESYWGGCGTGGTNWYARQSSRGWGCGGAGSHASTANTGDAGAKGVVVIEEYYK
jgi:hypothetical protein